MMWGKLAGLDVPSLRDSRGIHHNESCAIKRRLGHGGKIIRQLGFTIECGKLTLQVPMSAYSMLSKVPLLLYYTTNVRRLGALSSSIIVASWHRDDAAQGSSTVRSFLDPMGHTPLGRSRMIRVGV